MTNEELIAKINAEIERLKGQLIRGACAAQIEMETNCKEEAYDELLSFLSTLEPEKPVPADLEEAAKEYATEWHENPDGSAWKPYFEVSAIKAFIAGAKWQKEQDMEDWLKDRDGCFWDGVEEGKKAMKEQMLKEAVKWLVDDDYDELTDKGGFILGSVGIGYNGYYIPYSDLLKLPKEGER